MRVRPAAMRIVGLAVLAAGFVLVAAKGSEAARGTLVLVRPTDRLSIRGYLSEPDSFVGNLRFIARGGPVSDVTVLASDLSPTQGGQPISLHSITFSLPDSFPKDVPGNVSVKVSGIKEPGLYSGNIAIRVGADRIATIPLEVTAAGLPKVETVGSTVQLLLLNCANPDWGKWTDWRRLLKNLNCGLAEAFLPGRVQAPDARVPVADPTVGDTGPLKIRGGEVFLQGEFSGTVLESGAVVLTTTEVSTANIDYLNLSLARTKMPPDHYTGSLFLTLEGGRDRTKIPLDLKVRDGALLPFALLLAAIGAGYLGRRFLKKTLPEAEVEVQIMDARKAVERWQRPTHRRRLMRLINEAEAALSHGDIEGGKTQLAHANDLAGIYIDMYRSEELVKELEDPTTRDQLTQKLLSAETKAGEDELVEARKLVEQVEAQLDAILPPAASEGARLLTAMEGISSLHLALPPEAVERNEGLRWFRFRSWVLHRIRPVFYLGLVIGLAFLGLKTLYLDSDTFGARPFIDYWTVGAWGLTAEAVSGGIARLAASVAQRAARLVS